jgi:hypothetical protein
MIYANDSGNQWNVTDIFTFTVVNTPPSSVNLSAPLDMSTIYNRQPFFNWTQSYDPDGDNITYQFTLNENPNCEIEGGLECVVFPVSENVSSSNYSLVNHTLGIYLNDSLGIGTWYNWTVRAYDGYDYSPWADTFNVTVEGMVSITFDCDGCNQYVEFGDVFINEEYNTSEPFHADLTKPLIFENYGNVFVDVQIGVNETTPLWRSAYAPLNTSYFQYMAGNSTETNSFNWTASTQVWENMSSTMKYAVRYLNYSDLSDLAEIELKIRVPSDEIAGQRTTQIVLEARYTNGTNS